MNTGNVSGSGATAAYYQNLNAKRSGGTDAADKGGKEVQGDAYTAGSNAPAGVYSKGSPSMNKLWEMADAHYASMRGAVESLVGGITNQGSNGQAFWAVASNGGNSEFKVDSATQAKAKELISEDGYFGVKRTSERIIEFAKALAGSGASEKTIENLRKGAQAGFDYVGGLFGGFDKLPDVTKQTYDAVMKAFDDWVAGDKLTES